MSLLSFSESGRIARAPVPSSRGNERGRSAKGVSFRRDVTCSVIDGLGLVCLVHVGRETERAFSPVCLLVFSSIGSVHTVFAVCVWSRLDLRVDNRRQLHHGRHLWSSAQVATARPDTWWWFGAGQVSAPRRLTNTPASTTRHRLPPAQWDAAVTTPREPSSPPASECPAAA